MSQELLAAVGAVNVDLLGAMQKVEAEHGQPEASTATAVAELIPALIAANPQLSKIFDGALIMALVQWIKDHPDQALLLLAWILKMFGIVIPIPTPTV